MDDSNAYAHFVRGLLYYDAGEREKATSDLTRALVLGLEPEAAEYAQGILQDLQE
jgi:lipoprotein NlpI